MTVLRNTVKSERRRAIPIRVAREQSRRDVRDVDRASRDRPVAAGDRDHGLAQREVGWKQIVDLSW